MENPTPWTENHPQAQLHFGLDGKFRIRLTLHVMNFAVKFAGFYQMAIDPTGVLRGITLTHGTPGAPSQ